MDFAGGIVAAVFAIAALFFAMILGCAIYKEDVSDGKAIYIKGAEYRCRAVKR